MPEHDRSTQMIAAAFIIAFLIHRMVENIPTSFDVWPAKPVSSLIGTASVHDHQTTMGAIIYSEVNGPLDFVEHHPRPAIRPNQVLIQVHFSSLNPCDFKFRRNWVPNLLLPKPKIPGEDVSGIVVEVGSNVLFDGENNNNDVNVNNIKVGDRVAAMMPILGARWGALAEYVVVDASFVAKIGSINTTFQQAAAVPLVGLTAVQALALLNPKYQQSILIHAGAGGVGSFAIQYAKNVLHMDLIATTASEGKADLLKDLGANVVIDYRVQNFEDVIQDYDAVLDAMSWAYEERVLTSGVLKGRGHYLNILSSDWLSDGMERSNGIRSLWNLMYSNFRNMILPGHVPRYDVIHVTPNGRQLQAILDLVENGTIRPVIDRIFPLSEASEAFRYLEHGHATGKVILDHTRRQQGAD